MCRPDPPNDWERAGVCGQCARRVPASLAKAAIDPFSYALGLHAGPVIRFTSARFRGEFVHLESGELEVERNRSTFAGCACPRGVDVRLDSIAWCADAPDGS